MCKTIIRQQLPDIFGRSIIFSLSVVNHVLSLLFLSTFLLSPWNTKQGSREGGREGREEKKEREGGERARKKDVAFIILKNFMSNRVMKTSMKNNDNVYVEQFNLKNIFHFPWW